jgi:hypothetical protein
MYRLLTEDLRRGRIMKIVSQYVNGATIYPVTGLWKGKLENSLAIELSNVDKESVSDIVRDIKIENHQESVLVQKIQSKDKLR